MLFSKGAVVVLVAAIWINTYCCFIEKGEKFSTDAAQEGRGSSSWKYFGGFLCADIIESLFLRISAAAVRSFACSCSKHKDNFLFTSLCLCYYSSHR